MRFLKTLNDEWIKLEDINRFEHHRVNDEYVLEAFCVSNIAEKRYVLNIFKSEKDLIDHVTTLDESVSLMNERYGC